MLSYSESCERNKKPILAVLQEYLQHKQKVLEVGSGTAQHAVYFAKQLPHLFWLPSDQRVYLKDIQARVDAEATNNILPPLELDVAQKHWRVEEIDVIFSANTLHIMSEQHVEHFFRGVGQVLQGDGLLVVYGPFKYNGAYTSESNANFDVWLKQRDSLSGIRDFEWLDELAAQNGLSLIEDIDMPANNQCLVWRKA